MADDSSEINNVPSREKCEELIASFVSITETNSAIAQEFLQENEWCLERAVPAFFEALQNETQNDDDIIEVPTSNNAPSGSVGPFSDGKQLTSTPPPSLRFLTWNLDGLDDRCLKKRMTGVVSVIRKLEPDVIFFQEVIEEMAEYFKRKLPEYGMQQGESVDGYFNVTLTRVFTVRYDSHSIASFSNTRMGRHYVLTRLHVGSRHFALVNTHLESGKEFPQERIAQLRECFKSVESLPREVTVLVGGDLNLRDGEVVPAGVPNGWLDAWEASGARPEFRWTWDTRRNTNKGFGAFGPRARFDRVFFRPEAGKVALKEFGLVGAQKAEKTDMFLSDHWGLLANYSLNHV